MKKNFTKLSDSILHKVESFTQDEVIVSAAINFKTSDFDKLPVSRLGIKVVDGILKFNTPFLPPKEAGKYSKRNIDGFFIVRKDVPKIDKTFYLGERPVFGDWAKGSFSLWVTKKVYQRNEFKPEEREIVIELIETVSTEGGTTFTLKFSINDVLDRRSDDFKNKLLTYINLLQENIGKVDIFEATASFKEYIETIAVNWDIFPPGKRDDDMTRIMSGFKNNSLDVIERVGERYDFLKQFNPKKIINGLNGMQRYFGMQFNDEFIVFENIFTGNAIYFLFDDWEETSKLSRLEIMKLPNSKFVRIKHTKYWKERLTHEIKKRLDNSSTTQAA
jgi:hypothetical protein